MIFCAIPFGILSDRIGRKWILIIGLVGVPVAMFLCTCSLDPSYFLVASIVDRHSRRGVYSPLGTP